MLSNIPIPAYFTLSHLQHRPYLLFTSILKTGVIHTNWKTHTIEISGKGSGDVFHVNRRADHPAEHVNDLHQGMAAVGREFHSGACCKRIGIIRDQLLACILIRIIYVRYPTGGTITDSEALKILEHDGLQSGR